MSEETTMIEHWVYIGRRWSNKDRLVHFYVRLEDNQLPDSQDFIGHSKLAETPIGSVLAVTIVDPERSIYVSGKYGPRFLHKFHEARKVAEWEIEDRECRDEDLRRKLLKKGGGKGLEIDKALAPVVAAMKRTDAAGRRLIVAQMLEKLWGV